LIDVQFVTDLVLTGGENRNQELKASISWENELARFKITKTIMAMANISNGGRIIIGVQDDKGKYDPCGMTESDFESFNQDDVCDFVGKYADPFVNVQVFKVAEGHNRFVVITTEEFEKYPVICKKRYSAKNEKGEPSILENGDICTRTIGARPKSSKVTSSTDLRQILDLAIKKEVVTQIQEMSMLGVSITGAQVKTDEDKFKEQIEAFL